MGIGRWQRLLAGLLNTMTLLTAGVLLVATAAALPSLYREAFTILATGPAKERLTMLLDRVLLLVLSLDVARALLAAAIRRTLPVRVVVGIAVVAVLRELIAVEIRGLTPPMILSLGAVFGILAAAWMYIGRLEARSELREELGSIAGEQ